MCSTCMAIYTLSFIVSVVRQNDHVYLVASIDRRNWLENGQWPVVILYIILYTLIVQKVMWGDTMAG